MSATNYWIFWRLYKIARLTWTNSVHCRLKFKSLRDKCMSCFVWIATKLDDTMLSHIGIREFNKWIYLPEFSKGRSFPVCRDQLVTSRKRWCNQNGGCFEFASAFSDWKHARSKKRVTNLAYWKCVLYDYVTRKKIAFGGFTCPLRIDLCVISCSNVIGLCRKIYHPLS